MKTELFNYPDGSYVRFIHAIDTSKGDSPPYLMIDIGQRAMVLDNLKDGWIRVTMQYSSTVLEIDSRYVISDEQWNKIMLTARRIRLMYD